jgi:hypothetical protein
MAEEGRMLHDKHEDLSNLPTGLMTMFVLGALVLAAVLNRVGDWKRLRRMETKLKNMQSEIDLLKIKESRRLLIELNANSGPEWSPRPSP